MAELDPNAHVSELFDMLDVHSAGTVPVDTCVEILRRINTSLTYDAAAALASAACHVGCRDLKRDAFTAAVMHGLGIKSNRNFLCAMRDLIHSLRLAHRERYLMMNIKPNTPLPSLTENPNVVALFRELFAAEAHDELYITRPQLRKLMLAILPDDHISAANVVRAALSEDGTDLIGFYEFITLMQPITLRRPLSDLVDQFRCKRDMCEGLSSPRCLQPAGIRTKKTELAFALKPLGLLDAELQTYRRWDAEGQRRFTHASMHGLIEATSTAALPTSGPTINDEEGDAKKKDLESEVVSLRRENELLRHNILVLQTQKPPVRVEDGGRVVEMSGEEFFNAENEALRRELSDTRERLRISQAIIGLHDDTMNIGTMLRKGCTAREALLAVYPEESLLYGRYQQLLRVMERQQNAIGPPGCPARLLLTQLDVILQGYQALYRYHQGHVDSSDATRKPAYLKPTLLQRSDTSSVDAVLGRRRHRKPWVS